MKTVKKAGMLFLLLLLMVCSVFGEETMPYGITVKRNTLSNETDTTITEVDIPVFSCNDSTLEEYLRTTVTVPIEALRDSFPTEPSEKAGEDGKDKIAGGYSICGLWDNLLSVEATARYTPAGSSTSEVAFFSVLIDLQNKRILPLWEAFGCSEDELNQAIKYCLKNSANIENADNLPFPSVLHLTENALRVMYPAGVIQDKAVSLDLPWDLLGIGTPILPQAEETTPEPVEETPTPAPTETPPPTLNPDFTLSPVVTPTPMSLSQSDTETVSVLAHGLWKQLGSDGMVYYQFTEDGKLLKITVEEYTIEDDIITSDSISGRIRVGSDSAFTLYGNNGEMTGYVLNRQGDSVAPEEFVTPSPTPAPTPTPTPTPTPSPTPEPTPEPTPTPTPSPTPSPTPEPTLSPVQRLEQLVPTLSPDEEASFAKARTMKVYTAPDKNAWRSDSAQVDTRSDIIIYGRTEDNWLLVSYTIGSNAARGRVGYIGSDTIADISKVKLLDFSNEKFTIQKKTEATDDPLNAKKTLLTLEKGTEITVLAKFNDEWLYIETTYQNQICRVFIPQSSIQ